MSNVVKFQRSKRLPRRKRPPLNYGIPVVIALAAAIAWFASPPIPLGTGDQDQTVSESPSITAPTRTGRDDEVSRFQSSGARGVTFSMCGSFAPSNCVVDGDTFHFRGDKIRVADIDAPETHPPRCDYEARLGDQATEQLLALLNAGPFTLEPTGDGRDEDRYGRKLRIVMRDGASIGAVLVARGLARTWTGQRLPWCT